MGKNLITSAEFKAYAGISSTTQDAAINALIPKVSALVKSVCRTTFVDYLDDSLTETFKSSRNGILLLKELPVTTVSSVEFSEDYGLSYTTLVEFTDYVVDTETSQVELITVPYALYTKVNAFKVTYNAGYETLPEDLKLGIFDLMKYYLQHDVSVHSPKNIGSNTVQIEYINAAQIPAHIRRVLNLYSANYN